MSGDAPADPKAGPPPADTPADPSAGPPPEMAADPLAQMQMQTQAAMTALRRMMAMQQLALEAARAATLKELWFIMLNRTAGVVRFDRAWLWDMRVGPRVVGVSGQSTVNPRSPEAEAAAAVVKSLAAPAEASAISPPEKTGEVADDARRRYWLPILSGGGVRYGLLLERFAGPDWTEGDAKTLVPVAGFYAGALRMFGRAGTGRGRVLRFGGTAWALALAAVILALVFVRLPLRIVAPCEVVATSPSPVNAPLDGVIRTVLVRPGDSVAAGDELYRYDGDLVNEEFAVQKSQVAAARANLERVLSLSVSDKSVRAEARLIRNRLAQEETRLAAIADRRTRLSVTAPLAGTVIMGDPSAFVGRPIRIGEEVLLIADPRDNRLRIWLPQDDRIDFAPDGQVTVFLHADAGRSRRAALVYVAAHAQQGAEGMYGFMAEAEWLDGGADEVKLGLRGSAVLYGEEVALGYWLARKPLAAARRFLGL